MSSAVNPQRLDESVSCRHEVARLKGEMVHRDDLTGLFNYRHFALVMIFCLLGVQPVTGGIYRWVDADGKVHFGDRPPTEEAKEEMNIPQSPPNQGSGTDRATQRRRLLERFQEERYDRREAARKKAEEEKERVRKCALARDRLRIYTESGSLYDLTQDGKRRTLSFEERQRVTSEAERAVKRWCR